MIKQWLKLIQKEADEQENRIKESVKSMSDSRIETYIFEKKLDIDTLNAVLRSELITCMVVMVIANLSGVTDGATFIQINYAVILLIAYRLLIYFMELYRLKKYIKKIKKYQ